MHSPEDLGPSRVFFERLEANHLSTHPAIFRLSTWKQTLSEGLFSPIYFFPTHFSVTKKKLVRRCVTHTMTIIATAAATARVAIIGAIIDAEKFMGVLAWCDMVVQAIADTCACTAAFIDDINHCYVGLKDFNADAPYRYCFPAVQPAVCNWCDGIVAWLNALGFHNGEAFFVLVAWFALLVALILWPLARDVIDLFPCVRRELKQGLVT